MRHWQDVATRTPSGKTAYGGQEPRQPHPTSTSIMLNEYPKESWIHPGVEIRPSALHGKGLFAKEPLNAGEIVVIWGGDYFTQAELEERDLTGKIVMQLDVDLFSIEEPGDDPTYFMNHSCDPNVWMDDAITLVARRNVQCDEELTVDYALFEADEESQTSWTCSCASPLCRKRVTGRDWRLPECQSRYQGHFLPLINRRIADLAEDA